MRVSWFNVVVTVASARWKYGWVMIKFMNLSWQWAKESSFNKFQVSVRLQRMKSDFPLLITVSSIKWRHQTTIPPQFWLHLKGRKFFQAPELMVLSNAIRTFEPTYFTSTSSICTRGQYSVVRYQDRDH